VELSAFAHAAAMGERRGGVADPDALLVAAAQSDPEAFVALYDRYFERVFGYVCLRVASRAACEDITSQVFTSALANIGRFRGRGPFAAWLFRIARNAVRDYHRSPRQEPLSARLRAELPDHRAAPEELALARDRREQLRVLIADLRRDHQHLLALRYGAGLSYDELGAAMNIAPGTARVRVHRIVEELRRRYPHD
jgi:RNA polymerase sigma-70 factor (ECF subfamily)